MEALIQALANSGNVAVIVLVIANGGLLWLVRHQMTERREESKSRLEADVKLAEALTMLRAEIARIAR